MPDSSSKRNSGHVVYFHLLDVYFLFSLELSNLEPDQIDGKKRKRRKGEPLVTFNELRGRHEYLVKLVGHKLMGFEGPEFDQVSYEDEKGRKTFPEPFMKERAPLKYRLENPSWTQTAVETEAFELVDVHLRLHEDAALTVRVHFTQENPRALVVSDSSRCLSSLRKDAKGISVEVVKLFSKAWTEGTYSDVFNIKLDMKKVDAVESQLLEYEIIDFEHLVHRTGEPSPQKIPAKSIYNGEDRSIFQQLMGFARATRRIAWEKYSEKSLKYFAEKDFGNREDEIWLAYHERFVRQFPERDDDQEIRLFNNILLATEMLLARKAAMEHITHWSRHQLIEVRADLDTLAHGNGGIDERDVNSTISELHRLLSSILDPFAMTRGATRAFFIGTIDNLKSAMGLERLHQDAKDTFDFLYSTTLLYRQIEEARRTDRLARYALILGMISIGIAFISVLISLASSGVTPG
ncbi:MAG: hypothetical protein ACW99U_03825 [Candidatus Thorarchaeota archaeon]|jgi:hypothetical protein